MEKNSIQKRHFRLAYDSPINGKPLYILLDVLFEENHYAELVEKEIKNELLLTTPGVCRVRIPSPACILADKLTAFAPHTTGILLNTGKDMEIIKQLYDVTSLLEITTDAQAVRATYDEISKVEAGYRGLDQTPEECLWDSFRAAVCIASRGKLYPEDYPAYVKGIRELRSHIYAENFTPEVAALRSAEALYFILCLLCKQGFEPVLDYTGYIDQPLTDPRLVPLRYLKKVAPEAYAYAVKADGLLNR